MIVRRECVPRRPERVRGARRLVLQLRKHGD